MHTFAPRLRLKHLTPPLESIAFDALSLSPRSCYTHLYTELYEMNESGSPRIDQSRGGRGVHYGGKTRRARQFPPFEILDGELARAAKVKPAVADLSKGWILSSIRIFEIGLLV